MKNEQRDCIDNGSAYTIIPYSVLRPSTDVVTVKETYIVHDEGVFEDQFKQGVYGRAVEISANSISGVICRARASGPVKGVA